MNIRIASLARLGCALALCASIAAAGGAPLAWKGKTYDADAPPDGLSATQKEALATWAPWAKKHEYRFDFDPQGRVLLVTTAAASNVADRLKIVATAETWFDGVFPVPERKSAAPDEAGTAPAAAPAGDKPTHQPIPEDPEEPPAGAPPPKAKSGGATPVSSWGSGTVAPDTQCAVLVVVNGEKDYATLVDHLLSTRSYLAKWAAEARKKTGVTLEDPLVGAYIEGASGQEEWNGDHELLNRTVQLLLLRRFGQQPNWIVQGAAWEAEMALDATVYCFPYRDEFVYTAEHGSWPTDLRLAQKDRGAKPLDIAEIAGWRRGTWDGVAAKTAWGFVHFLASSDEKHKELSALLEDFRVTRDRDNRRSTGATTWERVPDWEIPNATQQKLVETHFGKNAFKKAIDAFRALKGGAPSPAKDAAKEPKSGARR